MNYPRVNLLRKNEQRYQGAVSRRFILVSAVVTPILMIAVLSGIKLVQYNGVQADLERSQEIWKSLEPKLDLYTEESRSLRTNKKVIELLEGWRGSRLSFADMLDEIQEVVPENIQFTRFLMKSNIAGDSYQTPDAMKQIFTLQIDGSALGERAEESVWRFHKDLLVIKKIEEMFETVELADIRKRSSSDGKSISEFRILGSNAAGGRP
jgi:hypothetical protein